MKHVTVLLGVLVLSVCALAQNGKVIQLSEKDAATAKRLYDAKTAANEAYAKFTGEISQRYTYDEKGNPTRSEWNNGWQFDKTFRFIVPGLGPGTWSGGTMPSLIVTPLPATLAVPRGCCCGTGLTITTGSFIVSGSGTLATTGCPCSCWGDTTITSNFVLEKH